MGKAARNEERKLKANWYNSVSTAFISVGLLGPLAARAVGALDASIDASFIVLVPVICLGASRTFHLIGRYELQELED